MLVLIIGPESTCTRFWTDLLSQHSQLKGTPQKSHGDLLDAQWREVEQGFPTVIPDNCITRRSVPHGTFGNAEYMSVPNLEKMLNICHNQGIESIVLIPTRSYYPHVKSWAKNRASCKGSLQAAMDQYNHAYKEIIRQVSGKWCFLSLEALMTDKQDYINSIFQFIGVKPEKLDYKPFNPNGKHYGYHELLRTSDPD